MTNGQKYDLLFNNNIFSMSNLSGLRDINNTQWIKFQDPRLIAYSPYIKESVVPTKFQKFKMMKCLHENRNNK